jgi:hypothetical protein
MTLEEFKDKVDLYSADLSRWPQELVKPALAFMKESRAAGDYFDGALLLDEKLRGYEPVAGDLSALENRVMLRIVSEKQDEKPVEKQAMPPVPVQAEAVQVRAKWLFAPSGGLLAIAFLGFFLGFTPPRQPAYMPLDPAAVAEEQLASLDSGIYDEYDGEVF